MEYRPVTLGGKPRLYPARSVTLIEESVLASLEDLGLSSRDSGPGRGGSPAGPPDRYIVYLFDDMHLAFGDLSQTRTAAERAIRELAEPGTSVALLTTSGAKYLEFTSDPEKVKEILTQIAPQTASGAPIVQCPRVGHYLADRIVNYGDRMAVDLVIPQAKACGRIPPDLLDGTRMVSQETAERIVQTAALQSLQEHDARSAAALLALKAAVQRLAVMPGQRSIVLVSPGFLTPESTLDFNDVVDRAARNGIPINTLDCRGLSTLPGFDVEDQRQIGLEKYARAEQLLQSGLLTELADGTGGVTSQGSNDYYGGFKRLAAAPESTYVLAFSPPDLKPDGAFHNLKVAVRHGKGLTVRARRGYFAPRQQVDPVEQAKEEIHNAVFSRGEIRDIPMTVRVESAGNPPKVSATMHVGLAGLRFENRDGRHRTVLAAAVGLFDANGNYVKGKQDRVELEYPDEKLAAARAAGLDVRTVLDAAPGKYLVRLVLRDEDGHLCSMSRMVEVR